MRIAGKLVSIGVFAVLAGCSSLNPFSSKNVPKNPPAPLADFKPTLGVHSAWTMTIGQAGNFTFSPALSGNSVFVAAADGSIARLDGANGHVQWRINAGMPLTAGVGSDGSTIVVAGEKGTLLAYDSDGKVRWKAQTSSEILSAPAVGQGLVIVRSLDNRITAFDANSGSRRWTVQRTTPALTLRSAPGIVIANSNVIVGLPGGKLLALALSNGGVRWEVAVSDPRGATEIERIADISGSPVVLGRDVCAVAYQGRIGCYDLNAGTARWVKDLSSEVGLGIDERFVFAADERGALAAFSRTSGQSVWRNDKLAYRHLSTPVSFGRAVVVGDGQGYIHFLSREDGSFIGRVSTDGSPTLAAPLVAGANLILQTQSGTVVALAAE
jgi:outer membrane protein assembly factor BamB